MDYLKNYLRRTFYETIGLSFFKTHMFVHLSFNIALVFLKTELFINSYAYVNDTMLPFNSLAAW